MFLALIVEDNASFRADLQAALQFRFPFVELATASGVREALAKVDLAQPDLMLVDLHLGDGNGLDLTRTLRSSGNHSVVIVMTTQDTPEYREAAFTSGADRFMAKGSIDFSAIFDVVQSMLAVRFRALIVAEESTFETQMRAFLNHAEPATVIAHVTDLDEAFAVALTLKPNLVVLGTAAGPERERTFCTLVHANQPNSGVTIVSVYDSNEDDGTDCPSDFCLGKGAAFGHEMSAIVDSLLAHRTILHAS
jgi:DNA-binding NarL/FixJ family response regulator